MHRRGGWPSLRALGMNGQRAGLSWTRMPVDTGVRAGTGLCAPERMHHKIDR